MSVFGSPDFAIDLGTATTRVSDRRENISLRPSVSRNRAALHQGVVVNAQAATEVLYSLLQTRRRRRMGRFRVLACAPSDVSPLERQMVRSCILETGASSVIMVPEPLAAAVGAGLDIGSKYAHFLADFGEGVTDCAVIRNGQIIASLAERTGCSDLRQTLVAFVRRTQGIDLPGAEADRLLRRTGLRRHGLIICQFHTGETPVTVELCLEALHAELRPAIGRMLAPVRELLKNLPAPIGAEVIEDGLFLTGGGALLPGLREAVAGENGIDTQVVPDPASSVIRGARRMLPLAASLDLWKAWGPRGRADS